MVKWAAGRGLQVVPQIFFRLWHAAVASRPDQQVQVQLLGLGEEIEDVGFPVGHTDQAHLGQFSLELRHRLQAGQPFLALFGGDGSTPAAMAFAKIFFGPFPDQMVGEAQGRFLRRDQQGRMVEQTLMFRVAQDTQTGGLGMGGEINLSSVLHGQNHGVIPQSLFGTLVMWRQ
jgi:hypothetical protein